MVKTTTGQTSMKLDDVVTMISPLDLLPNPYQPQSRAITTPEEAKKGWHSLERSGLIHFPVVRKAKSDGKYEVGDGWQRRNWYLYGYHEQKDDKYARMPCVVKDLDDRQMADLIPEANGERKDLNPLEWAEFYKKYLEEFKITQEELGKRLDISQSEIANTIRLLELPESIKQSIISQEITESAGRALLALNDNPKKQETFLKDSLANGWSVNELANRIQEERFDRTMSLTPQKNYYDNKAPRFLVSVCKDCGKVENLGPRWAPNRKEPRCTDAGCWKEKQKAAMAKEDAAQLAKLKKQGIEKVYGDNELNHSQYNSFYRMAGRSSRL